MSHLCSKMCKSFLPPKHFLQDLFASINTSDVRLLYQTTADKVKLVCFLSHF